MRRSLRQRPNLAAHVVGLALVAPLLAAPAVTVASADVASPTVEGPITSGRGTFIAATTFDLSPFGYLEQEYFISGTASSYANAGTFGSDGRWMATPADRAPYKTRIVVHRPTDAAKFNGTVVVEWLNVSGGLDSAPDWTSAHSEMLRDGFAWVGVSAQRVGIEGGTTIVGQLTISLKFVDPVRYGSLSHPGDSFSYDIYSQVGQAMRHPVGADPLGGLKVKRVIGSGNSQSASRLVTYVNAIHPLAGVYDGYLVHSRYRAAALSEPPQAVVATPSPGRIRSDLDVPVLILQTETDIFGLNFFKERQSDSKRIRLWEIAGTAHDDAYGLAVANSDPLGSAAAAALVVTSSPIPGIVCSSPINAGPAHYVLNAAFAALHRWVRRGTPARHAPHLEIASGSPPALARDPHGNALGGIRTPQLDVPIASLSGEGQSGSGFCLLFGTTEPFDAVTLASLYPDHRAYVAKVSRATRRAVRAGFMLKIDGKAIKEAAARSSIGE